MGLWLEDGQPVGRRVSIYDSQSQEVDFSQLGAITSSANYVPKFVSGNPSTNLANDPTRTVIFDTGTGVNGAIQAISCRFNDRRTVFALEIDGVEQFAISVDDLGDINVHNLDNSTQFPVRIGNDNAHLILDFGASFAGFADRFRVLGSSATGTRKIESYVILYRELVAA